MAQTAAAGRQRQFLHGRIAARAKTRNRLRERPLSQSAGMLRPAHRDLYGSWQRLYTALRFLFRSQRRAPDELEDDEPARVAEAAHRLGLRHVVITSVTRDDLADGGADHVRRCVLAVRERTGARRRSSDAGFLG